MKCRWHELDKDVLDIEEKGATIKDNARIKALHYYSQLKRPVFSCDSGLFFDNFNEKDQPGIYIRRVNGKRLDDDEMIEHYISLAKENNGEIICRYRNAICLVISEDEIYEYDGIDIGSEPFKIVSKPHKIRKEGFPLDCLSVEINSNEYYNDLNKHKYTGESMNDGFVNFFKRHMEKTNE